MRQGPNDVITVISAGPPLHELVKAHEVLAKEGVNIRIIDMFSVKPVDHVTLAKNIMETNGLAFVVEDHYPEGGLGGNFYNKRF